MHIYVVSLSQLLVLVGCCLLLFLFLHIDIFFTNNNFKNAKLLFLPAHLFIDCSVCISTMTLLIQLNKYINT